MVHWTGFEIWGATATGPVWAVKRTKQIVPVGPWKGEVLGGDGVQSRIMTPPARDLDYAHVACKQLSIFRHVICGSLVLDADPDSHVSGTCCIECHV